MIYNTRFNTYTDGGGWLTPDEGGPYLCKSERGSSVVLSPASLPSRTRVRFSALSMPLKMVPTAAVASADLSGTPGGKDTGGPPGGPPC